MCKISHKLTMGNFILERTNGWFWTRCAVVFPFRKNILHACFLYIFANKLSTYSWLTHHGPVPHISVAIFSAYFPSAPDMRADFSAHSPVPHIWGVTNCSILASPPNSRRSPASLISPVPHICGASRTSILTRVVWKISNVVTEILVVISDYRLP